MDREKVLSTIANPSKMFTDEWNDAYNELCDYTWKYRWHDLRKNPEDLPSDGKLILVAIAGSDVIICNAGETMEEAMERIFKKIRTGVASYDIDEHEWVGFDGFPMMVLPIAWREIEPFEEEE